MKKKISFFETNSLYNEVRILIYIFMKKYYLYIIMLLCE